MARLAAALDRCDGKLIPVKDANVAYGEIPLPFGEMHTEDLSKRELVRASVVAKLAQPAVTRHPLAAMIYKARYQVLTWFGIIRGAITLFTAARTGRTCLSPIGMDARILAIYWPATRNPHPSAHDADNVFPRVWICDSNRCYHQIG
jgi:hypothetical protein